MPSGHASHKGGAIKHSHDTGNLDPASDLAVNPDEILGEGDGYPFNAQGTDFNPAATERPQQSKQDNDED